MAALLPITPNPLSQTSQGETHVGQRPTPAGTEQLVRAAAFPRGLAKTLYQAARSADTGSGDREHVHEAVAAEQKVTVLAVLQNRWRYVLIAGDS